MTEARDVLDERAARQLERLAAVEALVPAIEALVPGLAESEPHLVSRLRNVVESKIVVARDGIASTKQDDVKKFAEALDLETMEATELIGRLLSLASGALVRATGLDNDLCRIADSLLGQVDARAGGVWNSISVPAHSELFDQRDDCIRVGWGGSGIWSLPLVLHELGHSAGSQLSALTEINGRVARAHPFLERANAISEGLDVKYSHQQEHWADVYAVYVGGPAPLAALVTLVFPPTRANTATSSHPSPAQRVAVMLDALSRLDQGEQAEMAGRWISGVWDSLLAAAEIEVDEDGTEAAAAVAEANLADLHACIPAAAYKGLPTAFEGAAALRRGEASPVSDEVRVVDVCNSAWLARLSPGEASLSDLSTDALSMAMAVSHRE